MGSLNEISLRERIRLNLVSFMGAADINQVQLAEKLGVSKGTVNNWVRGNNSPDVDMVPKICKVLDVSILDLYSPTKFEACKQTRGKEAPLYSSEAMKLAADYDELDKHGQRVVRLVADEEKARCTAARSAPNPELHWLAEELEKIQPTLIVKGELDDIISLIMKCVQGLTLDQQRMFLAQLQALIEGQIEAPPSSVQQ
ncbi:MAG: helix-turn-helix transcriptional regulator [Flavonifractor sp.]|jgi:transcriptional regulator with XRE-family HTH domain|nr:helix-turn-helix transcriptional regulator [Flavonifractor sp.]